MGGAQPPSGGCVLKHFFSSFFSAGRLQPPSGGCVLKPKLVERVVYRNVPAAFGRLCVETPAPF